jgi:uncharacterized protein (DUF1697 family)
VTPRTAGVENKVVLLRGINVGSANRIAMPALREALADAGFAKVRTYVQSGNIVLESGLDDEKLSEAVERLIADRFGLSVPALARGHAELAAVVSANPYPEQALQDPKHFQVTFLTDTLDRNAVLELQALAAETGELVAVDGRALYAWHPEGIHRSKLATRLTPKHLGVANVTARNWNTVTTLLEMAAGDGD